MWIWSPHTLLSYGKAPFTLQNCAVFMANTAVSELISPELLESWGLQNKTRVILALLCSVTVIPSCLKSLQLPHRDSLIVTRFCVSFKMGDFQKCIKGNVRTVCGSSLSTLPLQKQRPAFFCKPGKDTLKGP